MIDKKYTSGKWIFDKKNSKVIKEDGNILCIPYYTNCANMLEVEYNAKLISKAPILLEEIEKEIDFLKIIKKQLYELGGSMEFEVEERITYLEKLYLECVTL
jgi:hypothetical protein